MNIQEYLNYVGKERGESARARDAESEIKRVRERREKNWVMTTGRKRHG